MVCDILDLKCIFVNELVGSTVLAVVLGLVLYFIIASKNRFGFDTTITLLFPILFIMGLAVTGFSIIFAFATVFIGLMLAWIFNKLIGNR